MIVGRMLREPSSFTQPFAFFPRDRMVEKVRGRKGEREKKWRENSLKKEGDLCVDLSFVVK